MNKIISIIITGIFALSVVSCKTNTSQTSDNIFSEKKTERLIIGEWQVDDFKIETETDNNITTGLVKNMAKTVLNNLTVTFKEDKTVLVSFSMFGMKEQKEGYYAIDGNRLSLDFDNDEDAQPVVAVIRLIDSGKMKLEPDTESQEKVEEIREVILRKKE